MKGVSVIICCYNSALRLPETLRYLSLQKVPADIKWEVIIVNNLSADNTAQVAELEWAKYDINGVSFKVADQPRAGLSFAREKGMEEAGYDYLIFCDDDNWLYENYIENAYNLLEQWPGTGIIGGCGIPKPETDPPEWFAAYSSHYATGPQSSHNGVIEGSSPYVYGAGSVVRKSALKQLEALDFKLIASDRLNEKLSSGGDVEVCYAIKLLNYEIAYSDGLKFYHFIQKSRLTDQYLINLVYQFGYCNILHRPYFWLFNPALPGFKKTWLWTLLISLNIYLISLFNSLKRGAPLNKFTSKINVNHAKGRLAAIVKLNSVIEKHYISISRKFREIEKASN
jgi:glycosyltransferase involved in cell wall biosynthesis